MSVQPMTLPFGLPFALLTGLLVGLLVSGCDRTPSVQWPDIPASPGATTYSGSVEPILDTRLASRVTERELTVLDSRVELLPAGVTWAAHEEFRDAHAAGLRRVPERIPEPDAPVVMAEYQGAERTLFVIARATDDGTRLVVLTALTAPR